MINAWKKHDLTKFVAKEKQYYANMIQENKTELALVATQEEIEAFTKLNAKEQQQLIEAARKVHINTGHQPPSELARLLRQHGAPLASRAAMEKVKCSTCAEHGRPRPAPVATLNTAKEPWKVLGIDMKEFSTRTTKYKYMIFVDECSRLVRVKLMFKIPKAQHRNVTTTEVAEAYEHEWESIFGNPALVRHDPEGSLVSEEFMKFFSDKGILMQTTAGEAHWQLGIVERTIQTVFNTAEKIMNSTQVPFEQAVELAVSAHNTTERILGYSPSQWAFGRNPTWHNTLHEEGENTVNLSRDSSEAYQQKLKNQIEARNIFEEEKLKQKLQRAQRAKHRKYAVFVPGDTVFIWRQGLSKL